MITVTFSGPASDVLDEIRQFAGLQGSVAATPSVADPSPAEPPATTTVVEQPASTEKRGRGRPKKAAEPVEEAPVVEEPVAPSTATTEEYTDVEPPAPVAPPAKKATVADLRAACLAAADRTSFDEVKEVLLANWNCKVAAEVPADKLDEAVALIEKIGA